MKDPDKIKKLTKSEEALQNNNSTYGSVSSSKNHENLEISDISKEKKSRYTSTQKLTLLVLAIGDFCSGSLASLQAPFFPEEAEKKGATATEYGLIFGVYHITIVLTAPLIGKLVGHISPKFILNSGFFVLGTTSILFGILDLVKKGEAFVSLAFIVRISEGVGAACVRIASGTIVASQFNEDVGATYAILEMCTGVAVILGPVLGGALYELGGFKLPFIFVGSVTLIDSVIVMLVLPEAERRDKKPTKFSNIFKVWMKPNILVFSFSIFSTFGFVGFNAAGLEPHIRQTELSKLYVGLIFAILGLVYAISSPFWGWLHDRMCKSTVINLAGCFFFIIGILLVGPAPFIPLEPNVYLICLAMTAMGFATGAKTVSCFTGSLYSARVYGFPADLGTYGIITSIITSSKSLGSAFGPSFGGMILESWGFRYGTLLYLVIELLLVGLLIVIIMTEGGKSKVFRTTLRDKHRSIEEATKDSSADSKTSP